MADNITVDQLSIKVAAQTATAATSIDALATSLGRLSLVLGPTLTKLGALAPAMARINKSATRSAVAASTAAARGGATSQLVAGGSFAAAPMMGAPVVPANVSTALAGLGKGKTASALTTTTAKVSTLTTKVATLGKTGTKAVGSLGGSFIQLRSAIFFSMFAIAIVGGAIKGLAGAAIDFIETLNLFQVSMRANIVQANAFVDVMSRAYGLDPKRIMEYQSVFYSIAESSGIATKSAYALSEILTRLTFDYASLRNMKLEDVFIKMQGVLTGQARAMRSLGADISITRIKELALELGIKQSVTTMTNAEKSVLRLVAVYRASASAQGDMARTLEQPANLLRVLGDQFSITARAIGSAFIPMILTVVPYVIWFVRAIGMAFTALAKFMGVDLAAMQFEMPKLDTASAGVADNMGKAAGATAKGAKAAKQMKDYLLGIDELNIVSPPSAAGGGAGGGAGGALNMGDMLERIRKEMERLQTLPFEELMARIGASVTAGLAPLQPFITALQEMWDALVPFAALVWDGFIEMWQTVLIPLGLWTMNTVGVVFLKFFKGFMQFATDNPDVAKVIGGVLAVFAGFAGLNLALMILKGLSGLLFGMFGLKTLAATVLTPIANAFQAIAIWSGLSLGWIVLLAVLIGAIVYMWSTWGEELKVFFAMLWLNIWQALVEAWGAIVVFFAGIPAAIGAVFQGALDWLVKSGEDIMKGLDEGIRNIWKTVTDFFANIGTSIPALIVGAGQWLWKKGEEIMNGLWGGMKAIWAQITEWFANLNPFAPLSDAKREFIKKYFEPKGLPFGFTLEAQGGVNGVGQLFRAGEAGPELLGSFGGSKSTVMPLENSGFVEAMASAVYGAVSSAMDSAASGGDGNVYIDGQKVGQVLRSNDRRTGINAGLVRVTA